jgi:hypothetical protein
MSQELEKHLEIALQKLEKALENHMKTQVYDLEAEKMRIFVELIKEQLPHENTGITAR